MPEIPRPKYLYKFREHTAQNLENLKNGVIWVSSFANLNDPHDGQLDITIDKAVQLHGIANPLLVIHDPSGRPLFHLPTVFSSQEHEERHNPSTIAAYQQKSRQMKDYYRELGVYCLTERGSSSKMWATYGGNHTGFCIEFSTFDEEGNPHPNLDRFSPVRYANSYPNIDLGTLLLSTPSCQLNDLLMVKADEWKPEHEWRALFDKGNFQQSQPFKITSVTVGLNPKTELVNELKAITKDTHVAIKRAMKVSGQFELGSEQI